MGIHSSALQSQPSHFTALSFGAFPVLLLVLPVLTLFFSSFSFWLADFAMLAKLVICWLLRQAVNERSLESALSQKNLQTRW